MSTVSPRPIRLPVGVRDFLPGAAASRHRLAAALMSEFERWGYRRLITPIFECADVLERGLGSDAREAAIRFIEPATGDVVAIRPDITPQVARIAGTGLLDTSGPQRLCYEGAVARQGHRGRGPVELLQAGVELIGSGVPDGDAEILALAAAVLGLSGIKERCLDVGHASVVREALAPLDPTVRSHIADLLAVKDRSGIERAAAQVPRHLRELICALPTLFGRPVSVLAEVRGLRQPARVRRAVDEVERVLALASEMLPRDLMESITVDLGEVRGFDYYTGIRFAGYLDGSGDAVLAGGRYDELAGRYGTAARATGFAVDVEAIAAARVRLGLGDPAPGQGILVVCRPDGRRRASRLVGALRRSGIRAAIHLGRARAAAATARYAGEVGLTHVLTVDEEGAQLVAVADGERTDVAARVVSRAIRGSTEGLVTLLTRSSR